MKSIVCPSCGGHGYLTSRSGSWHSENTLVDSTDDCSRCNGKGRISILEVNSKDIREIKRDIREKQEERKECRLEIPRLSRKIKSFEKIVRYLKSKRR